MCPSIRPDQHHVRKDPLPAAALRKRSELGIEQWMVGDQRLLQSERAPEQLILHPPRIGRKLRLALSRDQPQLAVRPGFIDADHAGAEHRKHVGDDHLPLTPPVALAQNRVGSGHPPPYPLKLIDLGCAGRPPRIHGLHTSVIGTAFPAVVSRTAVLDEPTDCFADPAGAVLLHEVLAGDRYLGLVGPGPADFSGASGQ